MQVTPTTYFADTNIVLRYINTNDKQHLLVRAAVDRLLLRGEVVYIAPQVLIEFHNVATRPTKENGLGFTFVRARLEAQFIKATFVVLEETPAVFPTWETLIDAHQVMAKQVHDTRLVAVMQVHSVSHILTLNTVDFGRFQGVMVVAPQDVP